MTVVPLRRNRDFVLLQAGQLLSDAGSQSSAIAYPLLVLAMTGSAAQAGLVAFVRVLPVALLSLPAGVAADHYDRRRLMIGSDVVRCVAVGALAVAVLAGDVALWAILVAAFVEGAGTTLYSAAHAGALRAVVPVRQLPAAVATQTGRMAVVRLAGPPLGGALFGIGRALPFLVDAASYAFSTLALLAMRTPFQQAREPDPTPMRARLTQGFRFLWGHPFLRTCTMLFGLANFIGSAMPFALVVIGTRQGLSGARVGVLVAAFGVGLLVGSFLSGPVRRALPPRAVLLLELWTWTGSALFLVWPNVYVLTAAVLVTALAIPSTDSVVHGYRIAMTPDHLQGRVESAHRTVSLLIAPLGPLVVGVLVAGASPRAAVAVLAAFGLALALWGTLGRSLHRPPVDVRG